MIIVPDRIYLRSVPHEDNGSYLILPSKEKQLEVLIWSTHSLNDGRRIGVGRDATGIIALHIPQFNITIRI